MSYCQNCGKEIQDGEACSCQSSNTSVNVLTGSSKGMEFFKEGMMGVLKKLKGVLIPHSKISEIEESSRDNSFLWVFLFLAEILLISISIAIATTTILGIFYTFSGFGIFFKALFIGILIFIAVDFLTLLFMKLLHKNVTFNNVANTISVTLIPLTIAVILGLIVSIAIPRALTFILLVASVFTFLLNYIGVKKLSGMNDDIIWYYICYAMVIILVLSLFKI